MAKKKKQLSEKDLQSIKNYSEQRANELLEKSKTGEVVLVNPLDLFLAGPKFLQKWIASLPDKQSE